jgi:hypothetical protein
MKTGWGSSQWVVWLSEAYLLAGRVDEAIRLASADLEKCREHTEGGQRAWMLRLL